MNPADFYYLGKVLKSIGNKGYLLIYLDVDTPENYVMLESVFVELEYERIPFFVENLILKENQLARIKFQDVNTTEHADLFCGRALYLPLSLLPPLDGNRFYYHEVVGYQVVDMQFGPVGLLEQVLELPQQDLFQIRSNKKEVLIPVREEVIHLVDRIHRTLYVKAPEGLIELYL